MSNYFLPSALYSAGFWSLFLLLTTLNPDGDFPGGSRGISVSPVPEKNRVDIVVDGQWFTSYQYPEGLAKPVLYPLYTAEGAMLTRGFPLDPKPGERTDHPHHVGWWFNYGDVNGLDFWNNSDAIPKDRRDRYGAIRHKAVRKASSGKNQGMLEVSAEWLSPSGEVLLNEETQFVFSRKGNTRIITRRSTLTAGAKPVSFKDNKEGLTGIRVTRALELPSNEPAIFLDAHGNPTEVAAQSSESATGNYLSSEGIQGDEVWATRGKWMRLAGQVEGKPAALVLLDHPANTGYPTYWHARGYGLFAANPLGQEVFSKGKETLNFALAPGASVTFTYRLVVYSGKIPEKQEIDKEFEAFTRLK